MGFILREHQELVELVVVGMVEVLVVQDQMQQSILAVVEAEGDQTILIPPTEAQEVLE